MIFDDTDGDWSEVKTGTTKAIMPAVCLTVREGEDSACNTFDAPTARAVAAEIIACADRIDPPKKPASDEVNPFCTPPSEGATLPTTPTHSSYESLATLAKAIAYLPSSLRDELNALLATRIREVLSVLK